MIEEGFLRLLSLDSEQSQRSEPRQGQLHPACLKIKDNNRNSLANDILCVKESITCSVILLPFDSCDETNGFQLHIALQTKRDNKEI